MDDTEILAQLRPSVPRRVFAAVVLYGLALLLLYLSFLGSFPAFARIFLLALAIGAFFLAERQRRVWSQTIYLTPGGLITSEGVVIADLDQIASVDRGVFAFKPSQGFILRLKDRHSFSWSPGLWWRNGRRAGIGGITPAAQGKFMAERLAVLLAGDEVFDPFAPEPEENTPEIEAAPTEGETDAEAEARPEAVAEDQTDEGPEPAPEPEPEPAAEQEAQAPDEQPKK